MPSATAASSVSASARPKILTRRPYDGRRTQEDERIMALARKEVACLCADGPFASLCLDTRDN
jgi:hypothetical protein